MNIFPTAAKVVAGTLMALVGLIASEQIKPLMPDGTDFGIFTPINTALGFIAGWRVIGRRTGKGFVNAINLGISAGFVLVMWGLFLQGCYEMFQRSMERRYDGAFEALAAIFELMVEFGAYMIDRDVLTTLIAGSIFAGIVAEFSARRWR